MVRPDESIKQRRILFLLSVILGRKILKLKDDECQYKGLVLAGKTVSINPTYTFTVSVFSSTQYNFIYTEHHHDQQMHTYSGGGRGQHHLTKLKCSCRILKTYTQSNTSCLCLSFFKVSIPTAVSVLLSLCRKRLGSQFTPAAPQMKMTASGSLLITMRGTGGRTECRGLLLMRSWSPSMKLVTLPETLGTSWTEETQITSSGGSILCCQLML